MIFSISKVRCLLAVDRRRCAPAPGKVALDAPLDRRWDLAEVHQLHSRVQRRLPPLIRHHYLRPRTHITQRHCSPHIAPHFFLSEDPPSLCYPA